MAGHLPCGIMGLVLLQKRVCRSETALEFIANPKNVPIVTLICQPKVELPQMAHRSFLVVPPVLFPNVHKQH